jgi:pantetheine-phosphate adenylyltransferase
MKKAVFPGSFDPITKGHYELVKRALPLFDEIIVAMGVNSTKKYLFSEEDRLKMVNKAFEDMNTVKVISFQGLTVDFCKEHQAKYIVRGLRNSSDFDYEKSIAQMNKLVNNEIETVIFVTDPALSAISSTIVREIIKNGGDVAQFLPPNVKI